MIHTKKKSYTKNNTRKSRHTNTKHTKTKQYKHLKIGCHISITPSILDGIKYGESIGANAFQIFMGSNRSASLKTKTKFEPNETNEIQDYISRNNLTLIIHSIYLLNFCKYPPSSGRIKYQHDNIQYDLKYGKMIGAKCVVLHIGFKNDLTEDEALQNLILNINHIVKHMPDGITLALETSACRGSEMGCTLEQLSTIWEGIKHSNINSEKKVGFVIDTAHIFSSGYDISRQSGINNYLKQFDNMIGLNNICVFHINDSKYKLGAKRDEHIGIGYGNIFNTNEGLKSLKTIKQLCIKKNIPMILETHSAGKKEGNHNTEGIMYSKRHKDIKGIKGYEYEINLIKKL
jgi:deoxyribonuclease-4